MDIRVRWYYLFFLTLKNWCIISQGSIHCPRPANLHTQLKLLLCLRKVLHAFSNRKLHCLLRTITDCSVAPVKAEYKSRSEGTLPLFPGGKQFPCDGQNHEADYKDLLMRAIEKGRIKKGETERLYWADAFTGQQHPPGELPAKWAGAERLVLAKVSLFLGLDGVSPQNNPQMLPSLKENKTKQNRQMCWLTLRVRYWGFFPIDKAVVSERMDLCSKAL